MSQPEWMQKFKQIGQKSQRFDADGNLMVDSLDDKFKKPHLVANSTTPPWLKKKQEKTMQEKGDGDDDAAALFAQAASQPAVIKSDDGDQKEEEEDAAALFAQAASQPAVIKTDKSDEEEDAAALFAAAASRPAVIMSDDGDKDVAAGGLTSEDEEIVTKYKKMIRMGMPEGAVVQKMAVDEVPKHIQDAVLAPPPTEEPPKEPDETVSSAEAGTIIEEVIEESVVSSGVVEETHHSESTVRAPQDDAVAPETHELNQTVVVVRSSQDDVVAPESNEPNQTDQKMSDEDFGDTWVVDKDRLLNELSTTQFEEVEINRDTGNVHYEEVYLDENGNEVVVPVGDRANNEEEEEVFVDEDGNEIEYEEEEEDFAIEEEVVREEKTVRDKEVAGAEEMLPSYAELREAKEAELDEPVEPPYDPDYDVENQLKLLNRRSKSYRSRMAPWVPYVFLFSLIAASVFILFFVVLAEDDGIDPKSPPTAAPTPQEFIPLGPTNTGAIDVSATTSLDPVTESCGSFRSYQPHVIDQCNCTGSISIIADDIQERYKSLLKTFMPSVIPGFDEAIDSCDASNQALVWLSSGINNAGEAPDSVRRDRFALAYFFLGQGGVGWTDSNQWLSEADVCLWDRVSCDQIGQVVGLDVSSNRITGQLSGAIALMENIESVSAAENGLVGTIPPEIFATPKLRSLDLGFNELVGELPPFPSTSSLEMINLESNDLSGEIQTTIGNVEALTSLNLEGNKFQGNIPTELFRLPLVELFIASNIFNGTIPETIGDATNLTILTLGPNNFTGDIPTSIANLKNLTQLVIEDVPGLMGRLPAEYGIGLTSLVQFILTDTDVTGNIPQQFGLMTALETLDLSRNSLGRVIPTELGLLTNLKILNLENNAFSGTLPTEIGNAMGLTELKLQVNQLSGTIPNSIGRLSNLATLNLDGNFFGSRTPEEICNLRQGNLNEFTVDCPERLNDLVVVGVICSIPSCCTECF